MKNILVTGGAGYIGSHCCKELANNGYNVTVLDTLENGYIENVKWGNLVEGDVGNRDLVCDCIKYYQIDAVIHFAGYAYVGESIEHPIKYYNNNIVNSINLLGCMKDLGVKYIVFSSSCATYGVPKYIPINEEHLQQPINPYGFSKYVIEQALRDYERAYDLRFVSLRYFNAAGADVEGAIGEKHQPETHLIPNVLEAAFDKRKHVNIFGIDYNTKDGTCVRDYIHVSDLASAHVLALNYLIKKGNSNVFNLGTGIGYSVKEIIKAAEEVTGGEILFTEINRRAGDPGVLVASYEKALSQLNWSPKNSEIKNIISSAWQWLLKLKS
jgi:UDP-glucose 4-epimerase